MLGWSKSDKAKANCYKVAEVLIEAGADVNLKAKVCTLIGLM